MKLEDELSASELVQVLKNALAATARSGRAVELRALLGAVDALRIEVAQQIASESDLIAKRAPL